MYERVDGMLSNTARGYGRWVKQLAICMDFVAMEDVAAIIRHCPNLCTLIAKKNPRMQSKAESILNAIPKGLRRIELHRTWSIIRPVIPQEFAVILYQCSSIKAAFLSCEEIDFGDVLLPSQLAALVSWRPRIQHLKSLKRWGLPFLTHLTLRETEFSSELFSVVQHFGSHLLFLDIKQDVITKSTNNFFLQFCSSISKACPRLQGCVRILAGRLLWHQWLIPKSLLDWAVGVRARGIKVEDEDGMNPFYPAKHFSDECRLHYANMIDRGEEQANE
ncbi:hypothetical protein PILCRDRAFT_83542 [Piloderma croceum F 1598]|uniref:F-box domain-containing protein n=1 Tax=Piloderma croceum (strain F 1598) TaxID=765440 RepID=A0A0C3CRR1_PILCF|nr:hypothetical protein PILCRDRAFT_83542 [Piloderma croceum F 1598]